MRLSRIPAKLLTHVRIAGGTYFFTVNLAERRGNDLLVRRIADLREVFRQTRRDHPFILEAIVACPTTFIAYGGCRRMTMTFQPVGA